MKNLGRIVALVVSSDEWGVFLQDNENHLMRGGLTRKQAVALAVELRKLCNCHITDENCSYCHGIGGCHHCDS